MDTISREMHPLSTPFNTIAQEMLQESGTLRPEFNSMQMLLKQEVLLLPK